MPAIITECFKSRMSSTFVITKKELISVCLNPRYLEPFFFVPVGPFLQSLQLNTSGRKAIQDFF
jgi:hypothetical protein